MKQEGYPKLVLWDSREDTVGRNWEGVQDVKDTCIPVAFMLMYGKNHSNTVV